MSSTVGAGPSTSGGFKLTLKLGGSSSSVQSTSIAASTPVPAPAYSALTQLATSALEQAGSSSTHHTKRVEERAAKSVRKSREKRSEGSEEVHVSASKYRALKREFEELQSKQDDIAVALFRSQKRLVRIGEEKGALLDRILLLESAAGLTTEEGENAQSTSNTSDFPLLHPPPLPSLEDRPPEMPVITTSTDLTHATYRDPIGPPVASTSLPPRQRSQHLLSTLAAQKLRDSKEARRNAHGLPRNHFPAVAVLGLEGSTVAENVERALSGEILVSAAALKAKEQAKRAQKAEKAARAEANGHEKGKGKEIAAPPLNSLRDLPNPFSGGAGASIPPPPVPILAPAPIEAPQDLLSLGAGYMKAKQEFEEPASPAGSAMSYDDEGMSRLPEGAPVRKHRKSEPGEKVKTKRLRPTGITTGTWPIPFVPRNSDGSPKLPMPVGIMTLTNLGVVDPREHFHTERYIFPVGFECLRKYPSMIHKSETAIYSCRIVDGGDESPRFEIYASDQPGAPPLSGNTPTGAWSQIVRAANKIRVRNHSNSVSGPDYYGLAQNIVKALIQELPGASEASGYIWQNFVEDPDPKTGEIRSKKAVAGAPKKPTGAKRRFKSESGGFDDEGHSTAGIQLYTNPSYPTSTQQSMSPHTSPGFENYPVNVLPNISHQTSTAPNPYDLPVGASVDPGLAYAAYDPYAIPPPNFNPVQAAPLYGSNAPWEGSGQVPDANFQYPNVNPYGAYDASLQNGGFAVGMGRRTTSSDGSL